MKNFLIPIDFSNNSKVALEFAFRLAGRNNAKLFVYHINEAGNHPEKKEDLKEEMWAFCQDIKANIDLAEVYYEVDVIYGSSILALNDPNYLAIIDLIIMGTKGASGDGSILVGSNTVNLMDQIKKPLLVIPDESVFQEVDHILFCSDYKQTDIDFTLGPLKDLAKSLDSKVTLAHIKLHSGKPNPTHLEESKKEGLFFGKDVKHDYRLIQSDNVYDGINEFLDTDEEVQMLALVNRKHNFFDNLFRVNNTHRMAYHTNIPLLVLPE